MSFDHWHAEVKKINYHLPLLEMFAFDTTQLTSSSATGAAAAAGDMEEEEIEEGTQLSKGNSPDAKDKKEHEEVDWEAQQREIQKAATHPERTEKMELDNPKRVEQSDTTPVEEEELDASCSKPDTPADTSDEGPDEEVSSERDSDVERAVDALLQDPLPLEKETPDTAPTDQTTNDDPEVERKEEETPPVAPTLIDPTATLAPPPTAPKTASSKAEKSSNTILSRSCMLKTMGAAALLVALAVPFYTRYYK